MNDSGKDATQRGTPNTYRSVTVALAFVSVICTLSSILYLNFATEWGNSVEMARIASIFSIVAAAAVSFRASWRGRMASVATAAGSLLFLNSVPAGTCDLVGYTNAPWGFSFHISSNTVRYGLRPSYNQYACSTHVNWIAIVGGTTLVLIGLVISYSDGRSPPYRFRSGSDQRPSE